jgi:uncharacterized membrane protein
MQQTHALQPYDVSRSGPRSAGGHTEHTSSGAQQGANINVHPNERLASLALGALALAYGTARRSSFGTAAAALGSALVYRGVTGHCHLYRALGLSTFGQEHTLPR